MCNGVARPIARRVTTRRSRPSSTNSTPSSRRWRASRATPRVQPPEGGGMISVEVVGVLREGAVMLHRLYLPGGKAFFQLHLGGDGRPDECRYFSRLDEVTPAGRQEWGLWLDPAEGMIGWPSF